MGAPPAARPPRLSPASLERLDRFFAEVMECPVDLARSGGVHVRAGRARALPSWLGYTFPVFGVALATGAAISARADLAQPLLQAMGSDAQRALLDRAAVLRTHRAVRRLLPGIFSLAGDARAVGPELFRPSPNASRAELIPRDDPAAQSLRHRFDGEVFGVRGPRGTLVSWAALKLKSADVWEVAVATQAEYRGRGYGRDAVSAATDYALARDKLCLYVHDHDNRTSAFVSRALGYAVYGEVILAEY